MRIAMRADASTHIGTGHVMRCLALANELKLRGAEVCFVCRPFIGHLGERIIAEGHKLYLLHPETQAIKPEPDSAQTPPHAPWLGVSWETDLAQTQTALNGKYFDWIIVDHYSLDNRWESAMRQFSCKIMVIDDLADRTHDCDLLLDQNLYDDMKTRYNRLASSECVRLLGPYYSLIRPEFREVRKNIKKCENSIKRILIFFGGSDPSNETGKALEAIKLLGKPDINIDVVLGSTNSYREEIEGICSSMLKAKVHYQGTNICELMASADLAIGAGGSSTWERCAIGLPALVWCIAENQRAIANCSAQAGVCVNLGMAKDVYVQAVTDVLQSLINYRENLSAMTKKCLEVVDGKGLDRVIAGITK